MDDNELDKKIGRPAWTLRIRTWLQWALFLGVTGASAWWWFSHYSKKPSKEDVLKARDEYRLRHFEKSQKTQVVDGKEVRTKIVASSIAEQKPFHKAVMARKSEFDGCYTEYLFRSADRALGGAFVINWLVDQNQKALDVNVKKDEIDNQNFTRCMISELNQVKFPKPTKDLAVVEFEFVYKKEKLPAQ